LVDLQRKDNSMSTATLTERLIPRWVSSILQTRHTDATIASALTVADPWCPMEAIHEEDVLGIERLLDKYHGETVYRYANDNITELVIRFEPKRLNRRGVLLSFHEEDGNITRTDCRIIIFTPLGDYYRPATYDETPFVASYQTNVNESDIRDVMSWCSSRH
jgi:hypothetical protein